LKGGPNFRVHFSSSQVAASLWDYGEDELADHALAMTNNDLKGIQAIASNLEDPTFPLPIEGQRITHNHVMALAAVVLYEGELRPLPRTRRRAERDRPERFAPEPPDPGDAA
jgi:hypothetical protein